MLKNCLMLGLVLFGMVWSAFSDGPMETCFQFQTFGDDCYADGTKLEEGECYALVWRHNDLASSIEGLFSNTGAPVNPEKCEILGIFNVAMHDEYEGYQYACASNAWIILPNGHYSSHKDTGVYSVFVFDTRIWNGTEWVLGGKASDKTVASLRRYGLVADLEDIKIGTGINDDNGLGTFFAYNVPLKGMAFVNDDRYTSYGDWNTQYSCANTSVVCPVSFYSDVETEYTSKVIVIDQPIGVLPTPGSREGFAFAGWFTTGGEHVTPTTLVTSDMKLYAKWEPVPEPAFSEVTIANGKAILCVTNTMPNLNYDISWVAQLVDVLRTTNWVNSVKKGVETGPLTWEIDLQGKPQGYFRVLKK